MCGNFGFLGERAPRDRQTLLPERVLDIYERMGHETEIRGEQAGGGLVTARNQADQTVFVGTKVLNKKRSNLTRSLEKSFASARDKALLKGHRPAESVITGMWHYRYSTSSPPSIGETHWHEWTPAREVSVWRVESGKWIRRKENVNHRITHNGDFSAWRIFDRPIDYTTLGWWLERVLHTPNTTTGDSPKIAGMMDLLVTQGMWEASVRLAYQLEIVGSIEAAFDGQLPVKDAPSNAPSQQFLRHCATIFARVWQEHSSAGLLSTQQDLSCFKAQIVAISKRFSRSPWPEEKRVSFVKAVVDAFLHNDVYRATQLFMSKASGSFGLAAASTLSKKHLILCAQGQPMAVGFNLSEAYMVYASERAAVNAVLAGLPEAYCLELDQNVGEVAKVGTDHIYIHSMADGQELPDSTLEKRWVAVQNNPHIHRPSAESKDPVASDIQAIPKALKSIDAAWSDPASLNCQSAEHLIDLFIAKVKGFEERRKKAIKAGLSGNLNRSKTIDLLITGIENSLWLGERFAQDLSILFPLLQVEALSANQVLRGLKHSPQSLSLGEGSIVLAISHSGQTFPTLQATHALNTLYQQGVIGGLFILTGERNTLMGAALSNASIAEARAEAGAEAGEEAATQKQNFEQRIFTTGSCQRTAEPATLAVAATQETLTEILFYVAKRTRQAFPVSNPLGMTLSLESLRALDAIKIDFIDRSVVAIAGTTANGTAVKSASHQKLIESGRRWARHVTETPLAWGIHALYVFVVLGWAVPFGQVLSVTHLILKGILFPLGLANNAPLLALLYPLLSLVDIGIAIFGPWLWTIALRCAQGRKLFARTGKRMLVIGDVPWVYKLLNAYVSKLMSLSYGIASLEVHGADPQDHMLHEFGHRLSRGALVFLGVPDGRRTLEQKHDEAAVIMTSKQSDGVRNWGVGPEIVALGHNPEIRRQGFDDAIILSSKIEPTQIEESIADQQVKIEELRESRFSSFERLLASYVFFWAIAQKVTSFPLLRYQHWKSQSRTRIATTAAPVSGINQPYRQLSQEVSTRQIEEEYNRIVRGCFRPEKPTFHKMGHQVASPIAKNSAKNLLRRKPKGQMVRRSLR